MKRFRSGSSPTLWITLIYASTIIIPSALGDWSWGDVDIRREMACENYPISMRCPGHDVIQIETAIYGRQSVDKCSASSRETKNINCYLPDAKAITEEKCNNKTQCSFRVSGETFTDPCPGTKKYLEATFKCVRYMFACPGSLTGVGKEVVTTIDVPPQPGIWTKDPFYNTDHIFFGATSRNVVTEYSSWENFENGKALGDYTLQFNMAEGNMIVDDRNLFYLKENSRTIVKYSLITGRSTKQLTIPAPKGNNGRQGTDISLAVDERGLWVVYTRGKGVISFSKLDKDQLKITKIWTINRRVAESKYSFFICGVFYSVNANTGKIDYSYNTNLKSSQEKRGLDIEFDQVIPLQETSRRKLRKKSFLGHDSTSLTYNPRDQLLYMWDATNGNAIHFKLHFDGMDPSKARPPVTPTTTTKASTTSTRRRSTTTLSTTTTTTEIQEYEATTDVQEMPIELFPPEVYDQDYCQTITRNGLNWPLTRAGEFARQKCMDGQGGFAVWKCLRESSMIRPDWTVAGPDLSQCITWASDIASDYKSGLIDRATAFDSLSTEIAEDGKLDAKAVQAATEIVNKLFEDATLPSQENAKKIAESVTSISNNILSDKDAIGSLNTEEQTKVVETFMNSTEKAGFMYAETVALTPLLSRDPGPLVVSKGDVLLQVEVRDRPYGGLTSSSVTSFPDERTCTPGSQLCGSDSINIHDADILRQKGEGPAIVVFSLYKNVGEYLSPLESDWEMDSKVISASLKEPGYRASLVHPATIILSHNKTSSSPRRCVFWDHSGGPSGNWSDTGCSLLETNATHTTCQCDHLTSFAVLVNHQGVSMEPYHTRSLDIITKVGISISIVCFVLCILTFICFRNLHNDRNTVHANLCFSLLVAELIFLFGIDKIENADACSVIAGLLHYFFLAAFVWMALEGFQLYVLLVEVFEESSRVKWYYLAGYGIPAVIIGISAAIDHEGYGTDAVCWLEVDSGFIWSFVGPILVIILVNLGFLGMTVYKMYVHTMAFTDSGKINSIKASVRGASVLLCLLGTTWAFGILWINEDMPVLAYLFCIFNAFQGVFIFIFHCILQKKVRVEYTRCFSRFKCCQKLGVDSYVANSSSFQKQYTRGRFGAGTNGSVTQQSAQQSQLQRMWHETVAPRNSESTPVASETTQNRDQVRASTKTSNRNINQSNQVDRSYMQEDEVFLPPEDNQTNGNVANEAMNDFHYDRLQHHHHHPDEYLAFHREAQPMGHFNTGQVPKSNPHQPRLARDTVNQNNRTNHGEFGPKSVSHSKVQDLLLRDQDEAYLQEAPHCNDVAERWDSNRVQSHAYRRSLDENYGAKRDSGISLQRPPSNSRALEGTPPNRQDRNPTYRRSVENNLEDRKIKDCQNPVRTRPNFSGQNSLDESNRQRMGYDSHRRSATLDPASAPRCPMHRSMGIPLMGVRNKSGQPINGHRRQKSLSSDSDDPIVTDCSVSSAGSSFGHQPPIMSHHNNSCSYYEEPICHKRRLPDTVQMSGKHREHWHGRSNIIDQNRDENDLEVELITSSDNSIEANQGTLGYPCYLPPSPPMGGDDSSGTSAGRSVVSEISAYQKQGMAITQHKDTYGKPSPVDRMLKKTHNHINDRHSGDIIDVQGRTLSNI